VHAQIGGMPKHFFTRCQRLYKCMPTGMGVRGLWFLVRAMLRSRARLCDSSCGRPAAAPLPAAWGWPSTAEPVPSWPPVGGNGPAGLFWLRAGMQTAQKGLLGKVFQRPARSSISSYPPGPVGPILRKTRAPALRPPPNGFVTTPLPAPDLFCLCLPPFPSLTFFSAPPRIP